MNEKFFDLKRDKQDRIINAGLKVFAKHGYRHATTDDIVKEADAIMVARGDLGVEVPFYELPEIQKNLAELCLKMGKKCVTATQMLDSMIKNPRPTRAEVSDVANAVFNGTDAVMLSDETTVGNYPVDTVKTMAAICKNAEIHYS